MVVVLIEVQQIEEELLGSLGLLDYVVLSSVVVVAVKRRIKD